MRKGIHPEYVEVNVSCGCGNTFTTRSTRDKISVEICSNCHPFYTGRQKFVDTAGMVEKFKQRWGKPEERSKTAPVVSKKKKRAKQPTAASTLKSLPMQDSKGPRKAPPPEAEAPRKPAIRPDAPKPQAQQAPAPAVKPAEKPVEKPADQPKSES